MNLDPFGFFKVAPNGTIFSYDHQKVVIDSRQLTGEDFKAMTGCDMVTPGMPPSAELETEKCLWGYITPGSDVSVKRDNKLFEREDSEEDEVCRVGCQQTGECPTDGCRMCLVWVTLGDGSVWGQCEDWPWSII